MESGKTSEGEGESLTRSSATTNQSEGETPAPDQNDMQLRFKEDTLEQVLTCRTGNTGPEASTPLCDNGTTGQGSLGTSPANNSPDKLQDDISAGILESHDQGTETATFEVRMDMSNDESEEWETASEQSDKYEEIDDANKDKQHGNLDGGSKMGNGETISKQGSCRQLGETESKDSCQLVEEIGQSSETTDNGEFQNEQISTRHTRAWTADTVSDESMVPVDRTESENNASHAGIILGEESDTCGGHIIDEKTVPFVDSTRLHVEGTDREKSTTQEDKLVSEETVPCIDNTIPHVEETVVEEFGPHIEGSRAYVDQTVTLETADERTRSCEGTSGEEIYSRTEGTALQNEKASNECMEPTLSESVSQEAEPQVKDAVYEEAEPDVDKTRSHTEETAGERTQSHTKEIEHNGTGLQMNAMGIEQTVIVEETAGDQYSLKMDDLVRDGAGHQDKEAVNDGSQSPVEKTVREGMESHSEEDFEGTGPLIDELGSEEPNHYVEETVSEQLRHRMKEIVGDGTGPYREEEVDAEEIFGEETVHAIKTVSFAEETLDEGVMAETVTHNKDATSEETAPYVDVAEGIESSSGNNEVTEIVTEGAESVSGQTPTAKFEVDCMSFLDENGNPDVLSDKLQVVFAESMGQNLIDVTKEPSNNKAVVGSQPIMNKGSDVDHEEMIRSNITESVVESAEVVDKETVSHLSDSCPQDIVREETEDVGKETCTQETSNDRGHGIEITLINSQTIREHKIDDNGETLSRVTLAHYPESDIEEKLGDYEESVSKDTGDENLDMFNVETYFYKEAATEETSTEYRDSILKEAERGYKGNETSADCTDTGHNKECVEHLDSFSKSIIKEISAPARVVNQSEEIPASIVEIPDSDRRGIQTADNIFIEGIITEPSSEKGELARQTANQEKIELRAIVSAEELYKDMVQEIHENFLKYIVEETAAKKNETETIGIWDAKEPGLQNPEVEIETAWLEDERSEIKSVETEAKGNNMEANKMLSEDILEVVSHQRLFDVDTDGTSYMNNRTNAGTRTHMVEPDPLDKTIDNVANEDCEENKLENFDVTETSNASFMLSEPIHMRLIDFSYDSSKIVEVDNKLEEPNNNDVQLVDGGPSLDDPSYKVIMESAVLEPLHMGVMNFSSYDTSQILGVDDNLKDKNSVHVTDSGQSLGKSSYKDFTDSVSMEQRFEPKDTLNLSFQNKTVEHVQGVIQTVGPQDGEGLSEFSEDHKQFVHDELDCFNQALILDEVLKGDVISPKIELFAKPETSESALMTSSRPPKTSEQTLAMSSGPTETSKMVLTMSTEPILTENLLSDATSVFDNKDTAILHKEISQPTEDNWEINAPKLYTRQRSNTDPCIKYDQGEKDITQEADQHVKGSPRAQLRSITPPLDSFTAAFTTTSPQVFLKNKSLGPAQTSILYPIPDDNIEKEKVVKDITPKKNYEFFPTQILNPLFLINESTEEPGFYQEKPLVPGKGKLNKARYPSPPRDDQVLLKSQQSHHINETSDSSHISSEEASSTSSPAVQAVTPVWLPPRPLRHIESGREKDFRPLKSTENPLMRRATIRQKKNAYLSGSTSKRFGAANLPTIPQQGYLNDPGASHVPNSPRAPGARGHIPDESRPLSRQQKIHEQDVDQLKNKSPKDILAEAEERSEKKKVLESAETILRRGRRTTVQPPTMESTRNVHRRYSTLINTSGLLYQEYSDVALNQEIQRQKPGDSPAEEKDPGSPRLRRRLLSSQDSYLQRLSISSADSLWQDLPNIRDSVTFMSMTREEQKLQEAKFELIMSEALYLRSLNIAVDHFLRSAALQEILSPQDRQWLFSRLSEVRDASNDFLFDLEEEFENNMYNFQVCDVVISHEPNFRKVYLPYVTNQSYQDRTFQSLMNGNPRFQQVLAKLESDPVCQRLSLKSFLILPFQRITRLRLLLQNILKRSAPGSNEELQATEAHNAIEKLIRDCNESVQKMKDTEELILLNQKIQFECKIFPLISASRRLIKHGEVTSLEFNSVSFKWKITTRSVYIHLFNDCLLLSRVREGGRFVVFDHASDFRVERCEIKLHSNQKNIFRVFLRDSAAALGRDGSPDNQETEYMFRTETQSQKLRWICALSPPREEIDFLRGQGLHQMQCYKSYKGRENDELSLEKADILMVLQTSDDGWLCGLRLSDQHSGWFPLSHVQHISRNACLRNLQEEQRLQTARAKLQPTTTK